MEFAKVGYLQFKYTALRIFYPSNSHLISVQKYTFFSLSTYKNRGCSIAGISRMHITPLSTHRRLIRRLYTLFGPSSVRLFPIQTCLLVFYSFFFGSPCDTLNAYVHGTRSSAGLLEFWTTYRSPPPGPFNHAPFERTRSSEISRTYPYVSLYRLQCSWTCS